MVLQLKDGRYCFDKKLLRYLELQKDEKACSMLKEIQPAELQDSSAWTLLHHAAHYGNSFMTDYFIEKGCAINAQNKDQFTPLMVAVRKRRLRSADLLLEAGANVCPLERLAGILLTDVIDWISIESDFDEKSCPIRQDILEPILRKIKENSTTSDDRSIGKLLFESGCSLHHAICILKNAEVTRYYMEKGCPVDAREPGRGRAPLHMAVSAGDLDTVNVLLDHGADVNFQEYDGKNMLFYYDDRRDLDEKELEILRILMESGVLLALPDLYGVTPAERLLSDGQKEVVNIVLPFADPRARYSSTGNTLLHALVLNSEITDTKVFELISGQYFDVNACNNDGSTALQLAIHWKRPAEIIDFILRKGADINAFYTEMTTLKDIISRSWEMPDRGSTCIKIIELFLLYGGDLRKQLPTIKETLNTWYFDESSLAQLLVAHMVLLEEGGHSFQELFDPGVEARPVLAKLFKERKLQIEEIKLCKVYESTTMFDLLTICDKKLIHYAANDDIISNFEVLSQNIAYSEWYYFKYVKKRIARAVDVMKYQREASYVISVLTGIGPQLILDKIVEYLHVSDFYCLFFV